MTYSNEHALPIKCHIWCYEYKKRPFPFSFGVDSLNQVGVVIKIYVSMYPFSPAKNKARENS